MNASDSFPSDFIPQISRMWWTDPFEATRQALRIQSAALDGMKEATQQGVTMGKKAIETWITTLNAFDPKRREA